MGIEHNNQKTLVTSTIATLKMTTLDELLAKQFAKREFLIDPVMKQGESMMLWAAPGVGKTMLALSLAIAVAGGGKVLDLKGSGDHRVLLIDGEMNEQDLQERFAALVPAVEGCDAHKATKNLTILARQAQKLGTAFPDLATPEGQATVLELVTSRKFDLVILDNFSTLATLDDENSAAAMDPVLRFLMELKQGNIACVLIHHSGKNGEKYRGSSKIATTFEAILGLKKPDAVDETHRASFEMEWTKFRQIRNEATKGKSVWLEEDTDTKRLAWRHEASESEAVTRVLAELKSGKHTRQKDMALALRVSEGQLAKLKGRAIAERRVTAEEWKVYLSAAAEDRSTPADCAF